MTTSSACCTSSFRLASLNQSPASFPGHPFNPLTSLAAPSRSFSPRHHSALARTDPTSSPATTPALGLNMIFDKAIEARCETTVDSSGVGVREAEWILGATELENQDERDAKDLTPVVAAPDASSCFRAGEMTEAKVLSALSVSAAKVNDFRTRSS